MTTAHSPKQNPLLPFMVQKFERAAIVAHFGYEDEDSAMQSAGIQAAKKAVKVLDAIGSEGRLALVPLLENSDWGVRVFAAGYLVKVIPERALAVLQDIRAKCPTQARMTASRMLRRYEAGGFDM
jgi:hypothetical protein